MTGKIYHFKSLKSFTISSISSGCFGTICIFGNATPKGLAKYYIEKKFSSTIVYSDIEVSEITSFEDPLIKESSSFKDSEFGQLLDGPEYQISEHIKNNFLRYSNSIQKIINGDMEFENPSYAIFATIPYDIVH